MRIPKEDVLTIGNIYENGDTTYKAHQITTKNVACSEDEMELEIELAFLNERLEKLPMDTLKNIPIIKSLLEHEKKISYEE